MAYTSLIAPSTKKPPSQRYWFKSELHALVPYIHVTVPLSIWICLGAIFQSVLLLLPLSGVITHWRFYAALLPVLYVLTRMIHTALVYFNIIKNPLLEGSFDTRFTALVPDLDGNLPEQRETTPTKNKVAVLILGARFNHPLDAFGSPESFAFIDYVNNMFRDVEDQPQSESGFLGQTDTQIPIPSGGIEGLTISYWRSIEHIHKFSAGPSHTEGVQWWNRKEREWGYGPGTTSKIRHIGIFHEIFEAHAGCWETIYLNYQPTMLAATKYEKQTKDKNGKMISEWISPIVDARRGRLRSTRGRLGWDPLGDGRQLHEKEGEEMLEK